MNYAKFEEVASGILAENGSDINLLSAVHLSENDHTNILWQILRVRHHEEYPFLKSFCDKVLHLRYEDYFDCALQIGSGTQYQAIALKCSKGTKNDAKGYIDLLLKGEKTVVVIENKVCGAADISEQLVRYYHSFVPLQESDTYYEKIKDAYADYHAKHSDAYGKENVFMVYLTQDGKEPSEQSAFDLPAKLGRHFIAISYISSDDEHKSIVDWLKEDVLPNVPYMENGMLVQSVRMYLDYLTTNMIGVYDDGTKGTYSSISYRNLFQNVEIKTLIDELRENAKQDNRAYANQYDRCLKTYINRKLNEIIAKTSEGKKWQARWTTGYIMLYKSEWAKYGTFRHCNKVHWEMLRSMDATPDYKWSMHMEGEELSQLAKAHEATLKAVFGGKKVNAAGQTQKVSDFGLADQRYLLSLTDKEIQAYFEKLLNNQEFQSLTAATENWLRKVY